MPVDAWAQVVQQLLENRNVEENFQRVFHHYYSAVFGFFSRKGFSLEDCRDLTQEVFVEAYLSLGSLRSEAAFVSWLFSIARHVGFRHLERKRRSPSTPSDSAGATVTAIDSVESPGQDPLSRMLDLEKVAVVRTALEALPGRERDCLRARLVDGLNYREIGQRLGISESTVAVHIHRALKSLRTRLLPFLGDGGVPKEI